MFLSRVVTPPVAAQVEGLAEQVGVEHPRKLISFTLTGRLSRRCKRMIAPFCLQTPLELDFVYCARDVDGKKSLPENDSAL